MFTDFYFAKGNTHVFCEDHATSGNGIAIISDGCSGSGNTHIGSMVLANVLKNNLTIDRGDLSIVQTVKTALDIVERDFGIKNTDGTTPIDATLLYALELGREICIKAIGDGAVYIKYIDGDSQLFLLSYESGYPYYPIYSYDLNRKAKVDILNKSSYTLHSILTQAGGLEISNIKRDVLECHFSHNVTKGSVEYVSVMSDGVFSFLDAENNPIDPITIVKKMNDFKLLTSGVTQRTMNKFLKECKKNNITHYDDISISSIIFPKEITNASNS